MSGDAWQFSIQRGLQGALHRQDFHPLLRTRSLEHVSGTRLMAFYRECVGYGCALFISLGMENAEEGLPRASDIPSMSLVEGRYGAD